uniref:Uncharacterized protein n=1 Tax=Arundo donax TaxID=35708 RepID=A0A0A9F761_ARUDO
MLLLNFACSALFCLKNNSFWASASEADPLVRLTTVSCCRKGAICRGQADLA